MNKLYLIIIVIILLIGIPAAEASTPNLFGQPTTNGTLVGLEYSSPPGSVEISQNTVVPTDSITLLSYYTHNETLSIKGIQFQGYSEKNITTKQGNTTTTTQIKVMNDPQYFNCTKTIPGRQINSNTIHIPETLSKQNVKISINGTTFLFYHETSKSIIPKEITGIGITGLIAAVILANSILWIITLGIARLMIDRIYYWPKSSKFTWTALLFLLGLIYAAIYEEFYYQVTSSYKDIGEIVVFAFFIYLWISLNIIPSKSSKIFVERFVIDLNTAKKEILILYNGKTKDGRRIAINPKSKFEAIQRLFGIKKYIKYKDKYGNEIKDVDVIKNIDYDSSDMDIEGSYLLSPKIDIFNNLKSKETQKKWKDQDPEWINYGYIYNEETGEWERKKGIINRLISHIQKELWIPVSTYMQMKTAEHEAEKISYDDVIKDLEDKTIENTVLKQKVKQNGIIEGNELYNEIEKTKNLKREKKEEENKEVKENDE